MPLFDCVVDHTMVQAYDVIIDVMICKEYLIRNVIQNNKSTASLKSCT